MDLRSQMTIKTERFDGEYEEKYPLVYVFD